MRKIDNRQYKLTQIRRKPVHAQTNIKSKKSKGTNSKLDRRDMK